MKHGIVKMSDVLPLGMLADLVKPNPKPEVIKAPVRETPKVIGRPVLEPVNLQAAKMIMKSSWIHQPPMPPETLRQDELLALREENAKLKSVNENLIAENESLRRQIHALKQKKAPAVPTIQNNPIPPQIDLKQLERQKLLERLLI